jgi:acyl carrier protein
VASAIAEPELPRNPLEQAIADVWTDVLHISQLGIRDDFFKLGGHSLAATYIVIGLREKLTGIVSLRLIFDAPTVEQLAKRLEAEGVSIT